MSEPTEDNDERLAFGMIVKGMGAAFVFFAAILATLNGFRWVEETQLRPLEIANNISEQAVQECVIAKNEATIRKLEAQK